MTLGEIKIEALKMMFTNINTDLYVEDIPFYLNDETYKDYLVNMAGSINRCFSDLETKGAVPVKTYALDISQGITNGHYTRFDLSSIISDYYDIERLIYYSDREYDPTCYFIKEGDTIVIRNYNKDGTYMVMYRPMVKRVSASTDNSLVLQLPDTLCQAIPYFVKAELFRQDEPSEAGEARNWYEALVGQYLNSRHGNSPKKTTDYSMEDL